MTADARRARRPVRRLVAALAALAASAALLTGCLPAADGQEAGVGVPTTDLRTPAPAVSGGAGILPVERLSSATPRRVADGVIPPTNRWYSSLAFSPDLLPVYPSPLAVAPREDGLTLQVPPVVASERSITASFSGGLSIGFGTDSVEIVRADPVSVTVAYRAGATERARVTLAEGSPIVAVTATTDLDVALGSAPARVSDGAWSTVVDGVTYLLRGDVRVNGTTVAVPAGGSLQIAGLPRGADTSAWAAAIGTPVTGVTTSYALGDADATTRLSYDGTDRTVLVPFGGRDAATDCTLGTYDTPYGPAAACAATALSWTVPRITPTSAYDLSRIDAETRGGLVSQAAIDLAATPALPADTYFGGKALARIASFVELGRALGDEDLVRGATDRLATELAPWTDATACTGAAARCFVYDDVLHLVVGRSPSFGSEEGNDHHFHYGYFLFAAGVLASERPELLEGMRPVIDLLAADVAAGNADLPALRPFDPYRGHTWASGLAPFADGNNQESSSEAVAAWNGLATWASAAGEHDLLAEATWLLSSEADAARTLWLEPADLPTGFAHTMVSINWGGKRDYATWFSADPSAILGIQAVPVGPVSLQYLGASPDRVRANVADAGSAAFTGPLGDYVRAYSALGSADDAAAAHADFAARTTFDDGWSKALALAWVAAVQQRTDDR